jgi:hypothetical protein
MTPELKVLWRLRSRDARPLMEANGVEGCVLVSAGSTIEEMGYLWVLPMDTTSSAASSGGWICWPPTRSRPRAMGPLARAEGYRPYLRDLPEDDWILRPELDAVVKLPARPAFRCTDQAAASQHGPFVERYPELPSSSIIWRSHDQQGRTRPGPVTWSSSVNSSRPLQALRYPDRRRPGMDAGLVQPYLKRSSISLGQPPRLRKRLARGQSGRRLRQVGPSSMLLSST